MHEIERAFDSLDRGNLHHAAFLFYVADQALQLARLLCLDGPMEIPIGEELAG